MTVKDAVAKRFEQFYDQRKIHPNKLATHAVHIPILIYCLYIFILQTAPLANIKNACYTEAIKNIGGVPYAPSQRKQKQDQDRKSNR